MTASVLRNQTESARIGLRINGERLVKRVNVSARVSAGCIELMSVGRVQLLLWNIYDAHGGRAGAPALNLLTET